MKRPLNDANRPHRNDEWPYEVIGFIGGADGDRTHDLLTASSLKLESGQGFKDLRPAEPRKSTHFQRTSAPWAHPDLI